MANQVSARLKGDDYQHLYSWLVALELLLPGKKVKTVTIEDPLAGSVDDVTVRYEDDAETPDKFYQLKYHVDQRSEYSSNSLIAHKDNESSLLEKFWRTWKLLKNESRPVELYLISNWGWDSTDDFKAVIDGESKSVKPDFLTASKRSGLGKIREKWRNALRADEFEFAKFIRTLRFRCGNDCSDELAERVVERMERLGLKSDVAALLIVVGVVRTWIKKGKQQLVRGDIEQIIKDYDLRAAEDAEASITVYLNTVKTQKFEIQPDYLLDWRDYFEGEPNKKGHQLKNPAHWNTVLLPQLDALEAQVQQETSVKLIKARGFARLSAWLAFGHRFGETANFKIEVDQNGPHWRTDAKRADDFRLISVEENFGSGTADENDTVAVGVSVTYELDDDVRSYLNESEEKISSLLLLRPVRGLGRVCLRGAGDVVALADAVKDLTRRLVRRNRAQKLLFFYCGPLAGACFIGHRLNAVCREIQIMEDQQPGYAPSFLLT